MARVAARTKSLKDRSTRMFGPSDGTDATALFACRGCFHITDEENYDVGGADPGKLFCNQCGLHQVPKHVGWMRTDFLYPKPKRAKRKHRKAVRK